MYESAPAASPGAIIAERPPSASRRRLAERDARERRLAVPLVPCRAVPGGRGAAYRRRGDGAGPVLEGACAVEVGRRAVRARAAGRACSSNFPWTLYLPRDTVYRVRGRSRARGRELPVRARGSRPCCSDRRRSRVEVRGAGNATRQINNMTQPGFPAERILVVEAPMPAGNWSISAAQARRGRFPDEVRARGGRRLPRAGAGGVRTAAPLQPRARTRRELGRARPRPRHRPVRLPRSFPAAPGYDFYYLNALAGDHHSMADNDDPGLAWIRSSWPETPNTCASRSSRRYEHRSDDRRPPRRRDRRRQDRRSTPETLRELDGVSALDAHGRRPGSLGPGRPRARCRGGRDPRGTSRAASTRS